MDGGEGCIRRGAQCDRDDDVAGACGEFARGLVECVERWGHPGAASESDDDRRVAGEGGSIEAGGEIGLRPGGGDLGNLWHVDGGGGQAVHVGHRVRGVHQGWLEAGTIDREAGKGLGAEVLVLDQHVAHGGGRLEGCVALGRGRTGSHQ